MEGVRQQPAMPAGSRRSPADQAISQNSEDQAGDHCGGLQQLRNLCMIHRRPLPFDADRQES